MALNVSLDVLNFGDSMQMEKIIRSFETVLLHKHLAEQSRLATFKTDCLSINYVDFFWKNLLDITFVLASAFSKFLQSTGLAWH